MSQGGAAVRPGVPDRAAAGAGIAQKDPGMENRPPRAVPQNRLFIIQGNKHSPVIISLEFVSIFR
jgi:hypothetical protein